MAITDADLKNTATSMIAEGYGPTKEAMVSHLRTICEREDKTCDGCALLGNGRICRINGVAHGAKIAIRAALAHIHDRGGLVDGHMPDDPDKVTED